MDKITDEQLINWFTYHDPQDIAKRADVQVEVILSDFAQIRSQAQALAETIRDCCPASADTTVAIRMVRNAVMVANQAIACGGK